jgi:hypothetical protein
LSLAPKGVSLADPFRILRILEHDLRLDVHN